MSKEATTVETWVPTVYLKMTVNTWQKLADSFSEGMFQLSLTRLDSTCMIKQVAVGCIQTVAKYNRQANFECNFEGKDSAANYALIASRYT